MFSGKMGKLPSAQASNHNFAMVPKADIPRSSFNRSHTHKTTFDSGYLVPIYVDEALPGDTFALNLSAFARLATPICPVMDNMYMDFFFFAVPYRLVWDNWQKFNGEQIDPGDSTDYTVPVLTNSSPSWWTSSSLSDYFGVPAGATGTNKPICSLWHRAYNLIWNEWFRDENLQDSVVVDKDDGPDTPGDYQLLRRGKRHDYFTSCLPWPQKGPAVELPLGTSAPINRTADAGYWTAYITGTGTGGGNGDLDLSSNIVRNKTTGQALSFEPNGGLYADLTAATGATINSLRQAFQLQKLYERDARGGTRYTEIIRSHFGVVSPDARLQRPEYLGGGTRPISMTPIPQTSSTDATTPQGNLAAMGIAQASGIGFTKSFTEHCLLIGLVSVRADMAYQQGLHRMFSRQARFDFYWPALSHIGEQAVLNQEIYCDGTSADTQVFGYQERYAEYRYKPSIITGKLRSTYVGALDQWHLAQEFAARPSLNFEFIEERPPIDRVVAVPSEPQFIFDSYFDLKCARPMPTYSVPGLIDHF